MTLQEQEQSGWLEPALPRITCPACGFEKEEEDERCWNETCSEFALRGIVPPTASAAVLSAAAPIPRVVDEVGSKTLSQLGGIVPTAKARLAQKFAIGPLQDSIYYNLVGSSDVRRRSVARDCGHVGAVV